jgi:hypothetical protein
VRMGPPPAARVDRTRREDEIVRADRRVAEAGTLEEREERRADTG